jgi:hypothetical protein
MKYPLLIIFLLLFLGSWLFLAQPAEAALFGLFALLYALPGVILARYFWGHGPETYLWGAAWGILISAFLTVVVVWLAGWNILLLLAVLLFSAGLLLLLTRNKKGSLYSSEKWSTRDWITLLSALSLLIIILLIPYHNLGKLTPAGYVFPSLFGHDFIIRSSIAASLSQSVPPLFLPFSGEILDNYYWLSYMLPATVYRILGPHSSMHHLLTLTVFLYSLLFVAVLWSLLRIFLADSKARLWSLILALLAYNYYWIYALLKNGSDNLSNGVFSLLDKYKLLAHSDISHAWLRDLIFEPQAVLALTVLFTLVGMVHLNRESLRSNSFLTGFILILTFAADSFIGLIGILWFFSYLAYRFLSDKEKTLRLKQIMTGLVPVALIYILYLKIHMYSLGKSSGSVILKPYWLVLAFFPIYLLLEYGPLAILGIPGLLAKAKKHSHLVILALWCLLFIFLVQLSIENDVVIRKGQKILQFPLLIFTGLALSGLFAYSQRKLIRVIVPVLTLLALPTLVTDLKASADISNPKNVTYISAEDYQACQWLKQNTPVKSIIQSAPQYEGGKYELSLIALFAERQMVIGEWKVSRMQVVNDTTLLWRRYRDIDTLFGSENVQSALEIVKNYQIDYIYLGPRELKLYSPGCLKFGEHPELFQSVYSQNGVTIYKVLSRA